MKLRNLFICISLLLALASCKKDLQNPHTLPIDTAVVQQPVPYAITENFESGSKASYAIANVQLSTGLWSFNDALIGSLAADVKDGNKAVRLRTGDITMKFDVKGLTQISIRHAKYGNDAA
jgi:endonuclease G